jgi:hypothetical protein
VRPRHTDPETFLQRFASKKFHRFLGSRKRLRRPQKIQSEVPVDEFRWTSQLSTSTKVIRAELQEFYDNHNKNVLAFQALVDDPIQSISSREKTLDSHVYCQILETDLYLHSAKGLVTEIELLLVEMMEVCREKYVGDKMFPLLERQYGAPSHDTRFLMFPEYSNSQPTEVLSFDPAAVVKGSKPPPPRNQWVLTDADGKVIESPSNRRRGRHFDLSSTRSASDGILSCAEALVQAFVGISELLNHLTILPSDICTVHVDCEKNIATVRCQRWGGSYATEKTLPMQKTLRQIGSSREFYFRCQPANPQSERLCEVTPPLLLPISSSGLSLSRRRKEMTNWSIDGSGMTRHGVESITLPSLLTSISISARLS